MSAGGRPYVWFSLKELLDWFVIHSYIYMLPQSRKDDTTGNHFDDRCIVRWTYIDQQILGVRLGSAAQKIPSWKSLEMERRNRRGFERSCIWDVGRYQVGPALYVINSY